MKSNPPFFPALPWRPVLWGGVVLWAAAIFYLSSLTPRDMPEMPTFEFADKLLHAIAYMAGGGIFCMALRTSAEWKWAAVIFASILAIAAYGALDELHQMSTPGRSGADVWDWTADCVGAIIGASAIYFIYRRYESQRG